MAVVEKVKRNKSKSSDKIAHRAKNDAIIFIGTDEKPENQMTAFEKMEKLQTGLSKNDLEKLKSRTGLDYNKLSKILSVTRATLINKKGTEKYSYAVSERILNLADIYSFGYKVFEDEARFKDWMLSSNKALGGKSPYDIIDNQYGREEVKNLIGRIEYGVYS